MPTRGGARGGQGAGDMKALAGGVQKQRSRIAGWVNPAGASPISPVQATGQAQATGQQAEARMVNVGRGQYAPASVVTQAHADGPACGGTTRTTGEPCKLPASICDFSHKKPDGGPRSRPAATECARAAAECARAAAECARAAAECARAATAECARAAAECARAAAECARAELMRPTFARWRELSANTRQLQCSLARRLG